MHFGDCLQILHHRSNIDTISSMDWPITIWKFTCFREAEIALPVSQFQWNLLHLKDVNLYLQFRADIRFMHSKCLHKLLKIDTFHETGALSLQCCNFSWKPTSKLCSLLKQGSIEFSTNVTRGHAGAAITQRPREWWVVLSGFVSSLSLSLQIFLWCYSLRFLNYQESMFFSKCTKAIPTHVHKNCKLF